MQQSMTEAEFGCFGFVSCFRFLCFRFRLFYSSGKNASLKHGFYSPKLGVAVISEAGTPGISDPGERLVEAAIAAGVTVEVVPGPSAAITALVGSGLPASQFRFVGFQVCERAQKEPESAFERLGEEKGSNSGEPNFGRLSANWTRFVAFLRDQSLLASAATGS